MYGSYKQDFYLFPFILREFYKLVIVINIETFKKTVPGGPWITFFAGHGSNGIFPFEKMHSFKPSYTIDEEINITVTDIKKRSIGNKFSLQTKAGKWIIG